ncbi:hypothetical protein [Clostridium sp.]|uniref:hypothetical protein n=1 Tax=Clostridium sp. TaxID=1506 RepID=UPI002FCBAD7A
MGSTKLIGKVFVEQMTYQNEDNWILQRISPICAICNKNKFYNIYKRYEFDPNFKLFIIGSNYVIVCPYCGDAMELEIEEFLILKLFISINKKLEKRKISEEEHRVQTSKTLYKLKRK